MSERYEVMRQARAMRAYRLRAEGVSVKKTAELLGCEKAQVRALQILGERLLSNGSLSEEKK